MAGSGDKIANPNEHNREPGAGEEASAKDPEDVGLDGH
jgi:hypothetical protein